MNSICVLVPVLEFLLVNSAARRFLMAAGFQGTFIYINIYVCLFLRMHSKYLIFVSNATVLLSSAVQIKRERKLHSFLLTI